MITRRQIQDALFESVLHYDRMIAFVETKDRVRLSKQSFMLEAIGEVWRGGYCALCRLFECPDDGDRCIGCPLDPDATYDGGCHPFWQNMNRADTWGEWLVYARLLRQHIIDLLKECL